MEAEHNLSLIKKLRIKDAILKEDLQNKAICPGFPGEEARNTSEVCKKAIFKKELIQVNDPALKEIRNLELSEPASRLQGENRRLPNAKGV